LRVKLIKIGAKMVSHGRHGPDSRARGVATDVPPLIAQLLTPPASA
jgi:hypothetical protein